jgi:hypothetical protein
MIIQTEIIFSQIFVVYKYMFICILVLKVKRDMHKEK